MTVRALSESELDEAITHYREHGYARLGSMVSADGVAALRDRIDAIMMGEIGYPGLFFQIDSASGSYDDLTYGKGYEGPSLRYRKVEKLELDPLFHAHLKDEAFRAITRRVIGEEVTLYRACVFNKAAEHGGSHIPWHQDGGGFWGLDRDPVLQIWTAIDDAPEGGGCIEIVPGSHLRGLATPIGGVVPDDVFERANVKQTVSLPAEAGDVILIHNHAWHRSGRSVPGRARRALTVCYMDAATRCTRKKRAPREFFRVF
jgi:phytanoyl-CoA hydroxylase